jgi:para-nitrobenzyl esterase
LFHKAIVQSGYTLPDTPREQALQKGKRWPPIWAGKCDRRAAARHSARGVLAAHRAAEHRPGAYRRGLCSAGSDAGRLFAARQHPVPVMIGSTAMKPA